MYVSHLWQFKNSPRFLKLVQLSEIKLAAYVSRKKLFLFLFYSESEYSCFKTEVFRNLNIKPRALEKITWTEYIYM